MQAGTCHNYMQYLNFVNFHDDLYKDTKSKSIKFTANLYWTKTEISYMSRLPTYDISYTYLAEDRAEFMRTSEMCRKSCPILQIYYMYKIQIFI